jgi:hypothetical protein
VSRLLLDIAQELTDQANVDVVRVRIGRVDFGTPHEPAASP